MGGKMDGGQEAGAAEAGGWWTNRSGMRFTTAMCMTKAKLGFGVQGSKEPLFQSVTSLWHNLWSFFFVCFYQSFNKCSKWDYSSSIIWFLTKSRLEQWSGPFLDICGQVHMTPHRIALCPFYIQHTHHGSCFLMGCKFPPTSSNILPSTAQTWMPWWYVSTRHYAACVYAACRPTSSAQVVPGDKLLSWRAGEATQALQGPFCSWIC